MFLAGTHELVIDAKNRLSVPFAVRRKLSDEVGHSLYIMPGRRPGTLALYPEKYYERMRQHMPADDHLSDESYAYRQYEFSQTVLLDPDSQGRVLIPEWMLKQSGIGKDATMIGVNDHLELWNRTDFATFVAQMSPGYAERRAKSVQELNALAAVSMAATMRAETTAL